MSKLVNIHIQLHGVLLTGTCYYLENQGFWGATNQDMSLNETCFCAQLYGTLKLNVKKNSTILVIKLSRKPGLFIKPKKIWNGIDWSADYQNAQTYAAKPKVQSAYFER